MVVRALRIVRFRNLRATTFVPSARFNVIVGDNGQGKTNLLEALYLAGTLRSFRTQRADELIAWGEGQAEVAARVERGGLERVYQIQLAPRRKVVTLDGKTPRSVSEYFGDFNVVLFSPEDLRVPRGSPAGRRRFLDRAVFNHRATFLADAQRHARVLRSRNAVLREPQVREDLLDAWDEQLAAAGARVVVSRTRYLAELEPYFKAAYEAITQAGVAASLAYKSEAVSPDSVGDQAAVGAQLAAAIRESRRRDLVRRMTSVGPHVDDLDLRLDDRPARAFGSQGQLRALVLAWKTAEMHLLRTVHGDAPILLLDDVSSELDPQRNEYLFQWLDAIECQCFVTTTHPKHVLVTRNRQDFQLVAGAIRAC